MKDVFETFSIKFHNRLAFNTALSILKNEDYDAFFVDVGHADMLISFDDKTVLDSLVSDLSVCLIWDKPSFKGAADFTIR